MSYVESTESPFLASEQEASYSTDKVFVGLRFGAGGAKPDFLINIRKACDRYGLAADRVFVKDVDVDSALLALRAIEHSEFLISTSQGTARTYIWSYTMHWA